MTASLLVVTIDRLPAWLLPAYGSTWVSMPAVDELAGRGLVFDGLVATGADPAATAADLLGGQGRPLLAAAGPAVVVTDVADVAETLRGVDVRLVEPVPAGLPAAADDDTNLARLLDAAAAAVVAGRHRLVWCHVGSLGVSWDAPESFRDAYLDPDDPPPPSGAAIPSLAVSDDTDPDLLVAIRHVFAGQLTLLDRRLARLFAATPAEATVLLAGVRGMPLGLHGRVGPGPMPPFSELVRLPAVLVDRHGRMAGQRYGGLVVPADLGATLLDMAGGSGPTADRPWLGRILTGLFVDWTTTPRDRVIVATADGTAVVTPAWQMILPATPGAEPRLFAKPDDSFELCDVANRCPAAADELGAVAAAFAADDPERAWSMPLTPVATQPG